MAASKIWPEVDVSVCIVNWNCRQLLRDCLLSLEQCSREGLRTEIIVVDNASRDGAPELVAREFPGICLIRNSENVGFARANNQAAAIARGRFLFFLNNDTVVPPGTITALVAYMNANPGAAIVAPKLRHPNGELQIAHHRFPTMARLLRSTLLFRWMRLLPVTYGEPRWPSPSPEDAQVVEAVIGAAILVDERRFRQIGGWDETFPFGSEDFDLCQRIRAIGATIYYPTAEVVHHGRVSSRENVQFALPARKVGWIRLLRNAGHTQLSLLPFKIALSLDAILQLVLRSLDLAIVKLSTGRHRAVSKRIAEIKGLQSFVFHGLPAFWRA
jgi:N-acetylglucosaminyl-diphospho-decaprenol L-rhamnosyltransferase